MAKKKSIPIIIVEKIGKIPNGTILIERTFIQKIFFSYIEKLII